MKDIKRAWNLISNLQRSNNDRRLNKMPQIKGVVFEITSACNSRCIHCNIWKIKPKQKELTKQEIESLFQNKLFNNLEIIIITGGEPALRKDLKDIILSLHKCLPRTRFALSTNGLLPDRVAELVEELLKNNVPVDVGVSLDGLWDKHDEVRGIKGNFKKVDHLLHKLKNLRDDYDCNMSVVIGHTMSSRTTNSADELKKYADQFGFNFMTQLYEEFSYYGNSGESELTEYKGRHSLIHAIKRMPVSFHHEILINALRRNRPNQFRCSALRSFFLLRSCGEISPCLRFSDFSAGNIRDKSFSEIWHDQKAKEGRKLVQNCIGCSNTWAIDWSFDAWFLPFTRVIIRTLIKKRLLGKR